MGESQRLDCMVSLQDGALSLSYSLSFYDTGVGGYGIVAAGMESQNEGTFY